MPTPAQRKLQQQIDRYLASSTRWWNILRLSADLERRYQDEQRAAWIRETVIVSLIGVTLCNLYLISDYVENPAGFKRSLLIRLGIFTPICLLTTWIAARWQARYVREAMCLIAVTVTGACVLAVQAGVSAPVSAISESGFMIVVLLGTLVLPVPMLFAIAAVAALLTENTIFLAQDRWLNSGEKLTSGLLLCGFAVLSLVARGRSELLERRSYLLRLREQIRTQRYASLNRDLSDLVARDALTGLANRRGFQEYFQRVWDEAMANGTGLSIVMADIDKFKRLNDTFGHPFGDEVLTGVAEAFRDAVRDEQDMVARYGGEEFIVLLPNMDLAEACAAAERLCRKTRSRAFLPPGTSQPLHVTISLGVACAEDARAIEPEDLVAQADQAMYSAKRAGGNRVAWEPEVHAQLPASPFETPALSSCSESKVQPTNVCHP